MNTNDTRRKLKLACTVGAFCTAVAVYPSHAKENVTGLVTGDNNQRSSLDYADIITDPMAPIPVPLYEVGMKDIGGGASPSGGGIAGVDVSVYKEDFEFGQFYYGDGVGQKGWKGYSSGTAGGFQIGNVNDAGVAPSGFEFSTVDFLNRLQDPKTKDDCKVNTEGVVGRFGRHSGIIYSDGTGVLQASAFGPSFGPAPGYGASRGRLDVDVWIPGDPLTYDYDDVLDVYYLNETAIYFAPPIATSPTTCTTGYDALRLPNTYLRFMHFSGSPDFPQIRMLQAADDCSVDQVSFTLTIVTDPCGLDPVTELPANGVALGWELNQVYRVGIELPTAASDVPQQTNNELRVWFNNQLVVGPGSSATPTGSDQTAADVSYKCTAPPPGVTSGNDNGISRILFRAANQQKGQNVIFDNIGLRECDGVSDRITGLSTAEVNALCRGDLDGDGDVDVDDLGTVFVDWDANTTATNGPPPAGDADGDCDTDVDDLGIVFVEWSDTCPDADSIILGACCLADGSCDDDTGGAGADGGLTVNECQALGGLWQGGASRCATAVCNATPDNDLCSNAIEITLGACCLADDSCIDNTGAGITYADCTTAGGTWLGGLRCSDVDCTGTNTPPCDVILDGTDVIGYQCDWDTTYATTSGGLGVNNDDNNCLREFDKDVWFKFSANEAGAYVFSTVNDAFPHDGSASENAGCFCQSWDDPHICDTLLAVYDDSCAGELRACSDNFLAVDANFYSQFTVTVAESDLAAAKEFLVRVGGDRGGGLDNNGGIGVLTVLFEDNDLCRGATPLNISTTPGEGGNANVVFDDLREATQDSTDRDCALVGLIADTDGNCATQGDTTIGDIAPTIGRWFKVIGDGTTLTASLCGPGTTDEAQDLILSVYCGPGTDIDACLRPSGNDALFCAVASDRNCCGGGLGNDEAVSWCTENGKTYFILVHGNVKCGASDCNFGIEVVTDSVTCPENDQVLCGPRNDICSRATDLNDPLGTDCNDDDGTPCCLIDNNTGATDDDDDPIFGDVVCAGGTGPPPSVWADVWYKYTVPTAGLLVIDTCQSIPDGGTVNDTVLTVHDGGTVSSPTGCALIGNQVACSEDDCTVDDPVNGEFNSKLEMEVNANEIYYIRIGSFEDEDGTESADSGQFTVCVKLFGNDTIGCCCNREGVQQTNVTYANCSAQCGRTWRTGPLCSGSPCDEVAVPPHSGSRCSAFNATPGANAGNGQFDQVNGLRFLNWNKGQVGMMEDLFFCGVGGLGSGVSVDYIYHEWLDRSRPGEGTTSQHDQVLVRIYDLGNKPFTGMNAADHNTLSDSGGPIIFQHVFEVGILDDPAVDNDCLAGPPAPPYPSGHACEGKDGCKCDCGNFIGTDAECYRHTISDAVARSVVVNTSPAVCGTITYDSYRYDHPTNFNDGAGTALPLPAGVNEGEYALYVSWPQFTVQETFLATGSGAPNRSSPGGARGGGFFDINPDDSPRTCDPIYVNLCLVGPGCFNMSMCAGGTPIP